MKRITSNLKHWCRIGCLIKAPKSFRNQSSVSPLRCDSLPKKWKFLIFWGRIPTPATIEVKFCTAKRTQVPVGHAYSLTWIWATSRHCRSKNLIFGLWVNINTGSLPLSGNPAGKKQTPCFRTHSRCARGRPKKTWWDCVKNDIVSLGMSQKDAQSRNKWRRRMEN